jgi:hypothetical protein
MAGRLHKFLFRLHYKIQHFLPICQSAKAHDDMKLHDRASTTTGAVHIQDVRKPSNTGTGKSVAGGADAFSDRVEFSANLGWLARTLSPYEASRANHVQALAAQHQSGNYRPDSFATSQGMVREALVGHLAIAPA